MGDRRDSGEIREKYTMKRVRLGGGVRDYPEEASSASTCSAAGKRSAREMSDFPDTSETLLRCLMGDETGSWMEFTAVYEPAVYRVARRTGLQHADAMDVTQEVFAKVHCRIGQWDNERRDGRFRNWLHRLTVNASIDEIRRRRRQVVASGDSAVRQTLGQQPASCEDESTLIRMEYRRALFGVIADRVRVELSDMAWRAFWMTSVEGRGTAAVAETLGLTVGAVYAHKCRVLAKIRRQVQQLTADPPEESEAPR
jgi:RNA polymerase sigma-70 factor (ECF subfamily)